MKVLLIQPPIEDFYITSQRTQPTGLLYIASYLSAAGIDVEILDCITGISPKTITIDPDFEYMRDYYRPDASPAKLFCNYYRFGYSDEYFEKLILTKYNQTKVFCICSNFTAYYKTALNFGLIIKKLFPDKIVVIGGNNGIIMFKEFLTAGAADFIVFYEGENTLKTLIENITAPELVPNIAYLKNGEIIKTRAAANFDINDNFFKLDFIDADKYRIGKVKSISIVASRGCPYNCGFCSANFNVFKYTLKNINIFKSELEYNITKFDIGALNIEDDNFTLNREYAANICEFIKTKFTNLKLFFMNGLHYKRLDSKILKYLAAAGMKTLNISVGVINGEKYSRPTDIPKLLEIIRAARLLDLAVTVYFIIGLPNQTHSEIFELTQILINENVLFGPSVFYPLPNLPIIQNINPGDIKFSQMRSTAVSLETEQFKRDDILTFLRLFRILNLTAAANARSQVNNRACRDNRILKNLIDKIKIEKKLFGIIKADRHSNNNDALPYYYEYKQNEKISKIFIEKFF